MNRPVIEPRAAEDAESRAIVLDLGLAKILIGIVGAAVGVGIWVGTLVADHGGRIKAIEDNLTSIVDGMDRRAAARDTQMNALSARIDSLDTRVRPLEVSVGSIASSVAFIRERVDAGFSDLGDRMDRLEDRLGTAP